MRHPPRQEERTKMSEKKVEPKPRAFATNEAALFHELIVERYDEGERYRVFVRPDETEPDGVLVERGDEGFEHVAAIRKMVDASNEDRVVIIPKGAGIFEAYAVHDKSAREPATIEFSRSNSPDEHAQIDRLFRVLGEEELSEDEEECSIDADDEDRALVLPLNKRAKGDDIPRDVVAELLASHLAMQQERDEARGERDTTGQNFLESRAKIDALEGDAAILRARIAEFEARAEPVESKKVNRATYERMIEENLAWLLAQPRTLERDHIEAIVRHSPEQEYPTRAQPGADVVERLARVAWDARSATMCHESEPVPYEELDEPEKDEERAYARAVISALGAMGEEALPGDTAILEQAWPMVDRGAVTLECAALDAIRSRLSPVLGAQRVTIAEQGRRIAELEAELARVAEEAREMNRQAGVERRALVGEVLGAAHAHELGSCSHCDGEGGGGA